MLTFSEKVTNSSGSVLDTDDFTLIGFTDNNIVPTIKEQNNRTMATFTDLTFASSNTLLATIEVTGYRDEAGNSGVSKTFNIRNEEAQVVITVLEHPSAVTSANTMIKISK